MVLSHENRKTPLSGNQPPLIIAELGINHGGCIKTAKKMVDEAAKSGCECIKHQTHLVEDEMTEHAKSVKPPNADNSILGNNIRLIFDYG